MIRLVINCTEEMALVIRKLTLTGEVNIEGETAKSSDADKPRRRAIDYLGYIPEKDRPSWEEYAKSLGQQD